MSRHSLLASAVCIASAAAAAQESKAEIFDHWVSRMGKVQIVAARNGDSCLMCGGKQLARFPTWGHLRASFRLEGWRGDEVFLIQLNAADSTWFHILEVKQDGTHWVSPRFGNGGDLPSINWQSDRLVIVFEELDLPRGKVPPQTWRFENHHLTQVR